MPDIQEAELFPFASPETVLALARQLQGRILAIGPELEERHCLALLGELSLASLQLDKLEREILHTAAYRERQLARPVIPASKVLQLVPAWQRAASPRSRRARITTSCSPR